MEKTPSPKIPNGFDLAALYGRNTGYSDKSEDCRIYHLNNETGAGTITVYQVFQGIQAAFNDIHMAYCNQQQRTASNMIEINHCTEGRFECSVGKQFCCYMAHGDMATTWHIEFCYGSDLDALKQYDAGEYAYWLAAGISVDYSEDDVSNCINLFCTENLSES